VINGVPSPGAPSLEKLQDLIDAALEKAGNRRQEAGDWKPEQMSKREAQLGIFNCLDAGMTERRYE